MVHPLIPAKWCLADGLWLSQGLLAQYNGEALLIRGSAKHHGSLVEGLNHHTYGCRAEKQDLKDTDVLLCKKIFVFFTVLFQ